MDPIRPLPSRPATVATINNIPVILAIFLVFTLKVYVKQETVTRFSLKQFLKLKSWAGRLGQYWN